MFIFIIGNICDIIFIYLFKIIYLFIFYVNKWNNKIKVSFNHKIKYVILFLVFLSLSILFEFIYLQRL